MCKNLQIKLELITKYFFKANEITKRCNKSILEKTNAMQFRGGLPELYWELAFICITYPKNRSLYQDKYITLWED